MNRRVYEIILDHEASEALEREAGKRVLLPDKLVERIVRDWLVGKGNLRIY
ncbi:hypothetical protein ES703_47298 [subsurface metagenome]